MEVRDMLVKGRGRGSCLYFINQLGFLIEFKHITTLNLNILRKYNIICVSLVNATMCLN